MEDQAIFAIEQFIFDKKFKDATNALYKIVMEFREGKHFASLTETNKIDPELITNYTRLAGCLSDLFLNHTENIIDISLFTAWSICARELRAIFTISGFYRTDFLLNVFDLRFKEAIAQHSETNNRLPEIEQLAFRLLLFSMLENDGVIDFTIFFQFFPAATLMTLLSLLSSMVVITPHAAMQREKLLDLIPLFERQPLPDAPCLLDLAATWMLCSYASRRDKHATKFFLNRSIKSWLALKQIMPPQAYKTYNPDIKKPTMLVVLEFFNSKHSMGRSYGTALKNLCQQFSLVGLIVTAQEKITDKNYDCFESIITFDCFNADKMIINVDKMRSQLKKIGRLQPDIIFYPSLGMHQVAIVLANMRLAPIQMMSFGHPASSFCDTLDYGIIEADYAPESEDLFSEKMIVLPAESLSAEPLAALRQFIPEVKHVKEIIYIGISSVASKISASFLQTCKKIAEQSQRRIIFLFFINETEMTYLQCKKDILHSVPEAQVFYRMEPAAYLQHLSLCDLYLSTFPFGGANSVVDAMGVGLPVVCLRGEDIAGRTDSALISRHQLPSWLITHSEEEYIAAALRLIHQDDERLALNENIAARSKMLFPENNSHHQQQAHCFATACWQIYQKHSRLQSHTKKSFTLAELTELL